ncbi:benzoate 4-monooxygenase cytochrome P450 [Diaporthe eres]|nr:benzoate 4-monooxygenase cytochrome P450 [Diaporthe eres]
MNIAHPTPRVFQLHQVYGPVVRVAPDEVSYTSETAWRTIYGQRSVEMTKDPVFSLSKPSGAQAFDLIGDLAFGQDFGCLTKGKAAPFVAAIPFGAQELTFNQMLRYYGLLSVARFLKTIWKRLSTRPHGEVLGAREENMRRAVEVVRARISRGPTADRKDFWHYVLQNLKDENASENDPEISKRGISEPEMYANSFSITIAGSEGTATALAGATFLLLRHPREYQRAANEVRQEFIREADIQSSRVLANVPFIEAVLQETMRLYPPVSITMPRRVPEGGATIDGRFVTAGTTVGVNHLSCYRSCRNFENATSFRPERWLRASREEAYPDDNFAAFQPFSFGPRSCLGKNLARAEMCLLLARILWRFDLELVETEEGMSWLDRQRIWGFWQKPALLCRLTPAKWEVHTDCF